MPKLNLFVKLGASTLLLSLASILAIGTPTNLQAQETDGNSTIEDIEEDASDAVGETVTVRGGVNKIEGNTFKIAEEGFLQGSEVLVINATGEELPEIPDLDNELELQVTGEVGTFTTADNVVLIYYQQNSFVL